MGAEELTEKLEPEKAVPHEEWLLRLNFHPEHIDENGCVVPTAISLSDLKSRGYSIDRESLLDIAVVTERASQQASKNPTSRDKALLSRFECGPVRREIAIPEADYAFLVEASPKTKTETQRENPAHAHIKSAAMRPDSGLRRLRLMLLPHLQNLVGLTEYSAGRPVVTTAPEP